jgi:hypothetical protein
MGTVYEIVEGKGEETIGLSSIAPLSTCYSPPDFLELSDGIF